MEMVTSRNVNDVVGYLKKELVKTHEQEYEKVRPDDDGSTAWDDKSLIMSSDRPMNTDNS